MNIRKIESDPTPGTFFVRADSDIPLSVAKRMLEDTKRMSPPETPVVSISSETTPSAKRVGIIHKNTP